MSTVYTLPKDLTPISNMSISEISDSDLENAFLAVAIRHKDAIKSIHESMKAADEAYLKYLNENFEPVEEVAKKDRAVLNKAEKNIAEKFAELKQAYEKPLQTVEANIKSIRNAIKNASGAVDGAVKKYEEKQKAKKRIEIESYFNTKNFELLPLDKIFDGRWLNKTYKTADIQKEIDNKISAVYGNIKILESIPEYGMTVKALYLETLDMGEAMRQAEILKSNAERLAREKAEREARELHEQVEKNAAEERRELKIAAEDNRLKDLVNEAMDIEPEIDTSAKPEILEFTLRFWGTKEQLRGLRDYMTKNGIAYEKIAGGNV